MLAARRSSGAPLLLTPGFWLLTSALTPNEAGILLMHRDLTKYAGSAAFIRCATTSDSWLLPCDPLQRVMLKVRQTLRVTSFIQSGLAGGGARS
jgi:hypothetical protein